jgi:hypothetical protein
MVEKYYVATSAAKEMREQDPAEGLTASSCCERALRRADGADGVVCLSWTVAGMRRG